MLIKELLQSASKNTDGVCRKHFRVPKFDELGSTLLHRVRLKNTVEILQRWKDVSHCFLFNQIFQGCGNCVGNSTLGHQFDEIWIIIIIDDWIDKFCTVTIEKFVNINPIEEHLSGFRKNRREDCVILKKTLAPFVIVIETAGTASVGAVYARTGILALYSDWIFASMYCSCFVLLSVAASP